MPNIFGKTPKQYGMIKAQTKGMSDAAIMSALKAQNCGINFDHNFDRQNFRNDAQGMKDSNAAAFGLMMNNMEAVQAEIEQILYERFKLPEFVPINSSIPEGASTYSVRVIDKFGKGKFINKDGSNVETATGSVSKIVFGVEYAGLQPEWTLQELRESLFTGVPLSTVSLEAGAQGSLEHIQDVGFSGDASVGFTGLINSADVPLFTGTVPDFTDCTATEIIKFVNDLVTTIGQLSKEIVYDHFGMDTFCIVLPTQAYDRIATTKILDSDRTVAEWLAVNNLWTTRTGSPLVFKSLPRLLGAAANETDGRAIAYPWSSRILEMAIPIMPRIITMDSSSGYVIKAPMEYSMSGTNIKRNTLMLYADGVIDVA